MPAPVAAIANYNNVLTASMPNRRKTVADQWHQDHVVLMLFREMGGVDEYEGGSSIFENLNYARDTSIASRGEWDAVPLADIQHLRPAEFSAEHITGAATVNRFELAENRGAEKVLSLWDERVRNVVLTGEDELNRQICQGLGVGDEIGGLPFIVADAPAAGVVGGINRATAPWWRNQVDAAVGSFAANGLAFLRNLNGLINTGSRSHRTTASITTQIAYDAYELTQSANVRYQGPLATKLADAGFDALNWKGQPVVWDSAVLAGHWYMVNFENLKLRPNSMFNFHLDDPVMNEAQFVISSKLAWMGQMTTNDPRRLGVGTGIVA